MSTRARHKSNCIVKVVSDNPDIPESYQDVAGVFDISADVIAVDTNKNIRSAGKASITLVPRKDYLNLIFPNDVVVIYFSNGYVYDQVTGKERIDPGDSTGSKRTFIRSFFGFVDRVGRTKSVDAKGATTTRIKIVCSDFQKVFEKTALYTNAYITETHRIAIRQYISLLGGIQFFAQGLRLKGTPATVVNSLLLNFLGFGAQWQLPKNYPDLRGLSRDVTKPIPVDPSDFSKGFRFSPHPLDDEINLETTREESAFPDAEDKLIGSPRTPQLVAQYMQKDVDSPEGKARLGELYSQKSLLDILDRRYIEVFAVDGFTANHTSFNLSSSLWGAMKSFSNEPINELFCDLRLDPDLRSQAAIALKTESKIIGDRPSGSRPDNSVLISVKAKSVSIPAGIKTGVVNPLKQKNDPRFSEKTDEFGVYVGNNHAYVPAIVMREQPFEYHLEGTYDVTSIPEAEAKKIKLRIAADKKKVYEKDKLSRKLFNREGDLKLNLKLAIPPSALFNNKLQLKEPKALTASRNITVSRNIDDINSIVDNVRIRFSPTFFSDEQNHAIVDSVNPRYNSPHAGIRSTDATTRFIDFSVISETDIISEDLGRSDADVVNLIHYTDYEAGNARYLYKPFTPVMHPELIRRFGLRVFEGSSKFVKFAAQIKDLRRGIVDLMSRWNILLDMWSYHNAEYLSGTINMRGRPDIRVGYRLDIRERGESYYVEGVGQSWRYFEKGSTLRTSLSVTRGQPSKGKYNELKSEVPALSYEPPINLKFVNRKTGEELNNVGRLRDIAGEKFVVNSGFRTAQSSAYKRARNKGIKYNGF